MRFFSIFSLYATYTVNKDVYIYKLLVVFILAVLLPDLSTLWLYSSRKISMGVENKILVIWQHFKRFCYIFIVHAQKNGWVFDPWVWYCLKILRLSIVESPIDHHWQCVCSHCGRRTCSLLRWPVYRGQIFPIYLKFLTLFVYSLCIT